jgi:hypothetical protein
MVKPEAFLAIEASLSLRLATTYSALTSELFKNIKDALDNSEWDVADRLIRGINLSDVFDLNEEYIAYMSKVAVLFGATQVTSTPGTSAITLGFENQGVRSFIESFRLGIIHNLQESVVDTALQLIALKRAESNPASPEFKVSIKGDGAYLGKVLKEGKPSALLPFDSFMDKFGNSMFNMASSLHTSRLSAFGFTAEAGYLGITEYQINEQLDGRTCSVCSLMHGKTFKVSDARNLLDTVIRTQDPDELKQLQPWPSQSKDSLQELAGMTPSELVSRGWHVPPFHPRCRGLLTKSKTAPTLSLAGTTPNTKEPYVSSKEDFAQVGINLSPAKIDLWNKLIQKSPSSLIAHLTGETEDSVLATALGSKDPQKALGLANLAVTPNGVNLELQSSAFGSKSAVVQDYYFKKNKSLFIGLIKVASEDIPFAKQALKSVYGVAKDADLLSLSAIADGRMGGYAWAKYGFAPSPSQWNTIKKFIKSSESKMALAADAPSVEQKALELILRSNDPKDIFALADLPSLGEGLLSGTSWAGALDLADPESVARFLSTVGS